MAAVLRAYNASLVRRPMLTQCLTGSFLFGAGDVIAQQFIEERGTRHDFVRTGRLAFFGGAIFGPTITKWYQFLNRIKFSSPAKGVAYRVWLDQAILTPFGVAFFFGTMSLLEGRNIMEAKDRIQRNYTSTLLRNWAVFVPTQIINFGLVPHHLRFVVISVVSLFWNTYLSVVNARTGIKEAI